MLHLEVAYHYRCYYRDTLVCSALYVNLILILTEYNNHYRQVQVNYKIRVFFTGHSPRRSWLSAFTSSSTQRGSISFTPVPSRGRTGPARETLQESGSTEV